MTTTLKRLVRSEALWRISAAVLGGYAFCWGLIALTVAAFYRAGLEFHDGETVGNILGFLAYLVVFLWAFCAERVGRVWLVLAGGGAVMAALAALIQQLILKG